MTVILGILYVTGCEAKQTTENTSVDTTNEKEVVKEEIHNSIGLNSEEFRTNFNKELTSVLVKNVPLEIPSLEINKGPVQDTFNYEITPGFSINGVINHKDASIRSVDVSLNPNTSELEYPDRTILHYLLSKRLIKAVSPTLTDEEINSLLENIHLPENYEDDFGKGETVHNGLRYIHLNPGLIIESEKDI